MYAYLIIGIELVILYFVFWVVFIREPKPREISAELWGSYQSGQKDSETSANRSAFDLFNSSSAVRSFLPSRIKKRFYRMATLRRMRHRHHIKNGCACKCHKARIEKSSWSQLPAQVDVSQDISRQLAENFLLVLNRTLNKLSVKIPS